MDQLPFYLSKYIVQQDEVKYTPIDHACWRFILLTLKDFHSLHGHESYIQGLADTGIDTEQIPKISDISRKLEVFGWRALPVSGFIPPAAFMELQSLNVLPIASDMRALDHLMYTPAPDIVHEAAGHAPLLSNKEYADYLRQYAQVAKKSIISQEDLNIYEAIRILSDMKENPHSTAKEIKIAEQKLETLSKSVSHVSEASQLGRMNWWTAEYGLIGDLNNPKIFGAGLLSSVGESRWCLSQNVKKIPLSVNCVLQSYDITEPQPQLFVAKDFKHLSQVLEQFAATMAFNTGGIKGLDKIKMAATVNTIQLNSGLQISGTLKNYLMDAQGQISYLQLQGPTQLCWSDSEIQGHSIKYHKDGFGSPLGFLTSNPKKCLSNYSEVDWSKLNINWNSGEIIREKINNETQNELFIEKLSKPVQVKLNWTSGVQLEGSLVSRTSAGQKTILLSFENCTVMLGDQKLFDPAWGIYDMAIGSSIPSVFGGAADRKSFGETSDFVVAKVPTIKYSDEQIKLHELYKQVRELRNRQTSDTSVFLADCLELLKHNFPNDWLLTWEIFEIALIKQDKELMKTAQDQLFHFTKKNPLMSEIIEEGLKLVLKNKN